MKRYEVIQALIAASRPDADALVFANGRIVREALHLADRPNHFYMLSSMGHAATIGLGLAMAQPQRRVIVLDGDGNVMMNPAGLIHVGSAKPERFIHVVLDNQVYGTTGYQPCLSAQVDFEAMAMAAGYVKAIRVDSDLQAVLAAFQSLYDAQGPGLLHVMISADDLPDCPVFNLPPETIKTRFRAAMGVTA